MCNIRNILNIEQFNDFIKNNSIIKFSASWCGPCKVLENIIVNLDENKVNNVSFGEINVDEEFADEITRNLNIRNIPVTIFFREGKEVNRVVGIITEQEFYNKIRDAFS